MKKKKVCVVHAKTPFIYGGAEIMTENLVSELRKREYNTELIQIPFKWYPANSLYDNMLLWRMLDLEEINNEKIDLVIATKFPSYGVRHSNKVIWLTHQLRQVYDLYPTENGLSREPDGPEIRSKVKNFDSKVIAEAKDVYTISGNVTKRLKNYNNIQSEALYQPPSMVGRYFFEKFDNYILSVGRLDKLKRNSILIQALKYCDKEIKVKIAGKGKEMDNLIKLAKTCGVSDRVEFLGFVSNDDLLALYANALGVYFSPIDEDYGYITLEAFLSKKPVITAEDSGGVLEFVKNDINGIVCKAEAEEFGRAFQTLYYSKTKCKEFGEAGYQCVKDISWDNVIDRLTHTIR